MAKHWMASKLSASPGSAAPVAHATNVSRPTPMLPDPAHELLDCFTAILANVECVRLALDKGEPNAILEALADIDSDALRGSRTSKRMRAEGR